jgi:hypothetical protein
MSTFKKPLSQEDMVHKAIERLLKSSGYASWNVVSVTDEAKKYCYKTVDGDIGTVWKDFIQDRIDAGLF